MYAFEPSGSQNAYSPTFAPVPAPTTYGVVPQRPPARGRLGRSAAAYFGAGGSDGTTGALYAVNPDGTTRWRVTTEYLEGSSPAVAPDGTVYVGSMGSAGKLYAGRRGRERPFHAGRSSSSGGGAVLCAVDATGAARWSFQTLTNGGSGPLVFSPALAADGTIYVTSPDGALHPLR